jgi:hypothetical protein
MKTNKQIFTSADAAPRTCAKHTENRDLHRH